MLSFQLDGASFETADIRDLNDWHAKLNGAWRNLADDRLAVWHHLVRRARRLPARPAPSAPPSPPNSTRAYRARLRGERMFVNELYLTLVLPSGARRRRAGVQRYRAPSRQQRGVVGAGGRPQAAAGRGRATSPPTWSRYGPAPLCLYERDGLGSPSPWSCCASC